MTPVFIHGAGFTGECFNEQLAAFPGAHAPNLPGHLCEGSARSIADFAAFVAEYLTAHRIGDAVLCGHSMGGAVALECALQRRVPLRGVVLLGSGARLRVAPRIFERLDRGFDEGARFLAGYFFSEPSPQRIAWAVETMQRVGPTQTIADFRACDAFDALERLGEISVPLLAVTGERDALTPPKYAQALGDRVPGAQTRIVPGAGHFIMVERPAETNAAVATFLSGVA